MQAKKEDIVQNFQVALLIDDITEAKDLSDTLRELGIYAHYYSNLDEFWVAANAQTPDFTIIDVKKMSQGTLLFKNHPKVANGSMCFAFYYKEDTKFLLQSTYNFTHYGYIKKEISLLVQIRSLLRRRNEELRMLGLNGRLSERIDRLQKRSNKVLQDAQASYNFENQFQKLLDLTGRIGKANSQSGFIGQITNILSEWQDCEAYGIYHLSENKQKLTSPKMIRPQYKQLPELWLSKPCENGMDEFAREMAEEVAFDVFDQTIKVLKIFGAHTNPDILIIGKFVTPKLDDFQWELLEEKLSLAYSSLQLRNQSKDVERTRFLSTWEAMNYMDDIHFHQVKAKHKIVALDFSPIINVIKDKHGNRFYWKSFFNDYMEQIEELLTGDFKISHYGVQSLLVFVDGKYLETDYQKLKAINEDFPFWRYFEDSSLVLKEEMFPELKIIAPSSVNTIRQMGTSTTLRAPLNKEDQIPRRSLEV